MTAMEILVLLIVSAVCGSIGMAIGGFSRGGCLTSIALGFIGALLGMWLSREMNLPELSTLNVGDVQFPIVWSIIGSALFVAILSLLTRSRSRSV